VRYRENRGLQHRATLARHTDFLHLGEVGGPAVDHDAIGVTVNDVEVQARPRKIRWVLFFQGYEEVTEHSTQNRINLPFVIFNENK
jgi:hypothetical protein